MVLFSFSLAFILIFVYICCFLIGKSRKKWIKNPEVTQKDMELYEFGNLWDSLKVVVSLVKWTFDKSETKLPFIDKLYTLKNTKSSVVRLASLLNINLVINDDFDSVQNILHSKDHSTKLPDVLKKILSNGQIRGILWNDGHAWKELRKYTMKKLGQLGFGKKDQLSLILADLVPDLLDHVETVKEQSGNKIPIKNLFILPVVNVLWCIIGGRKFSQTDETFVKLHHSIDLIANFPIWKAYLLIHLPKNDFLANIFGYRSFHESIKYICDYTNAFIEAKIRLSEGKREATDFVDHFLLEIQKYKDHEEMKHVYRKEELVAILSDLLVAGMDTTTKYLEISLMYMILNPDVQKKVQEEIDSVIGTTTIPSYSDHRQKMPYTCATLMEIHRMGSIIPLTGRYTSTAEKKSVKQTQKAQILNLLWTVRMDASYWDDPHIFRPQRFLNEDKTLNTERMNRVIAFGAGGRKCPGENTSSASSFTFILSILQKYKIGKAVQNEVVGLGKNFGTVTQTLPFHITLDQR